MLDVLPKNIDGYPVVKELGRGVSGVVYQVKLPGRQKYAALKLFSGELSDADILRFRREFGALTRCRHEGIISVYGLGSVDNRPYILMEYVKGVPFDRSLRDGVIDRRPLPADRQEKLIRLVYLVLDTLNYLHSRRIVHRDIKPANIIVTAESTIKILDFGLAWNNRETDDPLIAGTAGYQAPEQLLQHPPDPRWDLYSFGVTLYEVLTGTHPFSECDSWQTLIEKQQANRFTPLKVLNPDLANNWEYFVSRLIALDPSKRFYSASQAIAELKRMTPQEILPEQKQDEDDKSWGILNPAWVGDEQIVSRTVKAVLNGKHVCYQAPSGSGRTRYLQEVLQHLKTRRVKTVMINVQNSNSKDLISTVLTYILPEKMANQLSGNRDIQMLNTYIETTKTGTVMPENLVHAVKRVLKKSDINPAVVLLIDDTDLCSSHVIEIIDELKKHRNQRLVMAGSVIPEPLTRNALMINWKTMKPDDVHRLITTMLSDSGVISTLVAEKIQRLTGGKAGTIVEFFKVCLRSGQLRYSKGQWLLYPPASTEPVSLALDESAEKITSKPEINRSLPETDRIDREILRILSAMPDPCCFDVISKMFAARDALLLEVLDRLIRSGWLLESVKKGKTCYQYENSKDKVCVYNAIAPFHKRYIHKRILDTFQKLCPDKSELQAIHVHSAESPVSEIELLEKAANHAQEQFENETAELFYDQIHQIINTNLTHRGYVQHGPEEWVFRFFNGFDDVFQQSMLAARERNFECLRKKSLDIWQSKGNVYGRTGNYGAAFDSFQHMLAGAQDIGNKKYESDALRQIGQILYYQRKLEESKKYFEKSLAIRKQIDDSPGIADCLNALGVIAQQMSKNKKAKSLFLESLNIKTDLKDERGIAYIRNNLANLYHLQKDYPNALKEFKLAADVSRKLNDELGLAYTLYNIGGVYMETEKFEDAIEALEKSLSIRRKMQDLQNMGHTLWQIAAAQNALGNKDKAIQNLVEASEVLEDVGLSDDADECKVFLDEVLKEKGEHNSN
jgi:serine/threonine protein kinase/tetratricopeptide (TPR) repeat protein